MSSRASSHNLNSPEVEANFTATVPLPQQSHREVARRIFTNTGLQYANIAVNLLSGLVMVYVLNRYLGLEGYGKYNLVLSFVPAFQILTDWGLTTTALRELAGDRSQTPALLGNLFLLRLVLSFSALAFCWLVVLLLNYPGKVQFAIFVFSGLLLLGPFEVFSLVFQVDLKGEYTAIPALLATLLNFGLISGAVMLNLGMVCIFGATVLTNALRLALTGGLSRRFVRPNFKINLGMWRRLLKMALPLGLSAIVSVIYQQLDILMLSRLDTGYAVGIYSAGLRLTNFAALLPIAIAGSLFPLFSNYYATDHARLRLLYRRSLDYMIVLALPMAVFVTLLSDKLVAFIFKPEFAPAALVLALNIWSVALLFMGIISGNLLIAANRQRTNLLLLVLALAVDAGLDLLLIPTLSYLGATFANLVSVFVLVSATLVISGKLIDFRYSWRVPGQVGFIVGVLSPLVFVTRDIPFFVTLPLLAILFFGLLLATGIIPLAELRRLFWRGRL